MVCVFVKEFRLELVVCCVEGVVLVGVVGLEVVYKLVYVLLVGVVGKGVGYDYFLVLML